jgi:hypothetical protein
LNLILFEGLGVENIVGANRLVFTGSFSFREPGREEKRRRIRSHPQNEGEPVKPAD